MREKARRAGILYVLFSVVAIVSEFFMPRFADASSIASAETAFRMTIVIGFATLVMHIVVVAALYDLFKEVDAFQSMLMAGLVFAGVAVALTNLANRFAALQFESLAAGFLRLQRSASALPVGFWGLWLFPFGMLVIKSRFIPKIYGILLLAAGAGYVITSFTAIAFPASRAAVARFAMPLYFGELPIIFWLVIAGVREVRQPAAQPA